MDIWRICRAKYEGTAFRGIGAQVTGGRWNHRGCPMVYASENLSLAALELFVHVTPGTIPDDLISIRGHLPDTVSTRVIVETELPRQWQDYPAPVALQTLGTNWVRDNLSLLLIVPSAVNPRERNILLNPAHPEVERLTVENGQPFHFNPRMFGK